jgi:preprotein translocase subunit YajC
MNKLKLVVGDEVFANGVKGIIQKVDENSALVELEIMIDGQKKTVQQWYANEALELINVKPEVAGDIAEEINEKVKNVEFGVIPEDEHITTKDISNSKKIVNKQKKGKDRI